MGGIGTGGLGNLQRALRAGLQWQVGTGVSTTSIPAVDGTGDAASFASGQWTGAYIFWLPGSTNAGAFTPITGNSASALTVSAMGTEAAEGDAFLLFAGPPGAITGLGGNLPQDGDANRATLSFLPVGGTDGTDEHEQLQIPGTGGLLAAGGGALKSSAGGAVKASAGYLAYVRSIASSSRSFEVTWVGVYDGIDSTGTLVYANWIGAGEVVRFDRAMSTGIYMQHSDGVLEVGYV